MDRVGVEPTTSAQKLPLSMCSILNSVTIFGSIFLLVPIAFLFKRTYVDRYHYAFIAWFIVSSLFWSADAENQQARFTGQITPAEYYVAVFTIENIGRIDVFSSKALKNL
jgi:hypothetical protein